MKDGTLRLWIDEESAEKADFMNIRSRRIALDELSAKLKETVLRIESQLVKKKKRMT